MTSQVVPRLSLEGVQQLFSLSSFKYFELNCLVLEASMWRGEKRLWPSERRDIDDDMEWEVQGDGLTLFASLKSHLKAWALDSSCFPKPVWSAVCWEPYFTEEESWTFQAAHLSPRNMRKGRDSQKCWAALGELSQWAPGPALWLHVDPAEEGKFELSCVENLSNPSILKIFRPCSTPCCKT